jgi:hypothetical protein
MLNFVEMIFSTLASQSLRAGARLLVVGGSSTVSSAGGWFFAKFEHNQYVALF